MGLVRPCISCSKIGLCRIIWCRMGRFKMSSSIIWKSSLLSLILSVLWQSLSSNVQMFLSLCLIPPSLTLESHSISSLNTKMFCELNLILSLLRDWSLSTITDQNLWKSDLKEQTLTNLKADSLYLYAHWRISNNICHFVIFEKSKMTCSFDGNEAARLPYLTEF